MKNWAGNVTYGAHRLLEPRSVEELQEAVAASSSLRPIGTGFSFSRVVDTTGELLSMRSVPRRLEIDPAGSTVVVDGGATYGEICGPLHEAGVAIHNLPSLPHITVAGACATGSHGSGGRLPVLAAALVGIELVLADGTLRTIDEGSAEDDGSAIPLEAAAVSLGALGLVSALRLRIEPTFELRQDVFEGLPSRAFDAAFEEATALAESASFFTTWREDGFHQVWLKRRVAPGEDAAELPAFHGAAAATRDLHPIPGFAADACTPQLGRPGPWHERLPHFRLSHTPSSGEELQSEYFIARSDAGAAFRALEAMRDRLAPVVQVSEIRTIAADELWMSGAYRRETVAFHFTWIADAHRVLPLLPEVEQALDPFQPRAHWGKLATLAPERVAARQPRLADFARLAAAVDPSGKLRNATLDALFEVA